MYPAAAAAAGPSVRPCRHGTKRVLFSRHFTCRRCSLAQTDKVAHPTGGWSVDIFAAERHIQKKKKKRKYGSLCLDAHKFRTPLILRYMALLHSTTPQNLHYTTTCLYLLHTTTTATKMPYVSNQGCIVSLAVPCSYPRHT